MNRPVRAGAVIAALLLAGPLLPLHGHGGLAAQEAADTTDTTDTADRPFVPGGVYDKPYLTNLLGRTALGGYAEAHARWERVDGATEEAGFEARRVNLFTSTRVSDVVRMALELEIEEGGEEIKLEFAAIDVALHPAATLRAGMILVPLGRFNLSHDSPRNDFTDRPLVATRLLGVTLSQPGLGVLGSLPTGGGGRLTWEVYGVNGFDAGVVEASPDGLRVEGGRQNFEDANASPAVTGRVAWSPRLGTELGVSAHHGAWNAFSSEGLEIDRRRDLTLAALDVEADLGRVRFEGEGALVRIDLPPGLEGIFQERQRGFYLQAVVPFGRGALAAMPDGWLEAGLRVDAVDFDADRRGDSLRQLTAGLQLQTTADTVLKLDWVRGASFDGFNNRTDHAGLLFSVATYF